ncbi:MAG: hypothetical protein ACT4QC_13865 [Planctomycetaceae bacterium]
MKRVFTVGFIVCYLAALGYGNFCHMLGHGITAHPFMYFIVWDMFCGWSAYDSRTYIIGEGEDRKYYELAPGPWGQFIPWGKLGRQHYDNVNNHGRRLALNALKHSRHEPISRIFVIEECWSKKFNLPEAVWATRYDEPKNVHKYYRVRAVVMPDGSVARSYNSWTHNQAIMMAADNPRLYQQAASGRSLFVLDGQKVGRELMINSGTGTGAERSQPPVSPVGSPLGN